MLHFGYRFVKGSFWQHIQEKSLLWNSKSSQSLSAIAHTDFVSWTNGFCGLNNHATRQINGVVVIEVADFTVSRNETSIVGMRMVGKRAQPSAFDGESQSENDVFSPLDFASVRQGSRTGSVGFDKLRVVYDSSVI